MSFSSLVILHVSSAKTWRGGEQQIAYLVQELRLKGVTQYVFCVEKAPLATWCESQGITAITYRKRNSFDLPLANRIRVICKENKITILHAHDSHAHTFAWLSAECFANPTPIVVSRRVDFPINHRNLFTRRKYNHPRIKAIICISHQIKKILAPAIRDNHKLTVVHSGIDASKFTAASGKLRQTYNLSKDIPLVGNIAAIADHKDYFTFVNTAKILLDRGLNIRFLIIGGDGGQQVAIENYIKANELENYILLTGYREDIPAIFSELDVLLFTSKEEGLGTTILDAFACRVPVVATRAGGIPEMIEHQRTGLLADIGDFTTLASHVETLLTNFLLRQELTQQAWEQLREFSKESMATGVLVVYKKVLHLD